MTRLLAFGLWVALLTVACGGAKVATPPAPVQEVDPLMAQVLPVDSQIEVGVLENGLRYYIRTNAKPEARAEFRLVVNAGSVLEDEDQQGLAHFVEHMAFNGTEHFAKQELVDYLESIGMRFGPDLNAYTSFDETVYMLQVPTDSAEVVEKSFQILADWAQGLTLEGEEIDKERGVVIEEWRSRRGAGARMLDKQRPVLFKDSRYAERMPIGQKAVLDTFAHESLRRFYRQWYRPELMAIIAVGDFDPVAVQELIFTYFGAIPASESPVKRPSYGVPDHDETLFTVAADPEATSATVAVFHMFDPPDEGTVGAYRRFIGEALYHNMINQRLRELTLKPDPPFLGASSSRQRLVRTKYGYVLGAAVVEDGIERGLEAILTEAKRVRLHGFTATELEREKKELLRGVERAHKERDKTQSDRFAAEYSRNFLFGEPIPGIEYEYGLYQTFLPKISLDEINYIARQTSAETNRVVTVNMPQKEGLHQPTEAELAAVFSRVAQAQVDPYVDRTSDRPLVEDIPEPGTIVERKPLLALGVEEWTLSNGVKVVLKPTDFKNDQVLLSAYSLGGHSLVEDKDFVAAVTAASVVGEGGVGHLDQIELNKALAGKALGLSPWISELQEGFSGSASPQDLETLFQLIYLYATAPRADSTAFVSYQTRLQGMIANRSASPEAAFGDSLQVTLAQHHYRARPWTEALLDEMDLERSLQIYQDRFGDLGDFTFFFVGNFTWGTIRPLVERYLATLPTSGRQEHWRDIGMEPPKGVIEKTLRRGLEPKSLNRLVFSGPFEWTRQNVYDIQAMASVLRIKLREVLREDMGGTYGVGVWASLSKFPRQEYTLSVHFGSDPERAEELLGVVYNQIDSLKTVGTDETYLEKVRESQRRQREVQVKENSFWLEALRSAYINGFDPRMLLRYGELIKGLKPEDVQRAAQQYFNMENLVRISLFPEGE